MWWLGFAYGFWVVTQEKVFSDWFLFSSYLFGSRDRQLCAIGCSCPLVTWFTLIWLRWRLFLLIVSGTVSVKNCCNCISRSCSFRCLRIISYRSFYCNPLLLMLIDLYTAIGSIHHCSSISTLNTSWFLTPD